MNKKRLEYVEGYKGFACLCVMLSHFFAAFCNVWVTSLPERQHTGAWFETWIGTTPLNLFYNGNFGVRVFFITSGFVLSYAFFKNGNEMYLKKGAVKRYFRLFLPVVLVNIISLGTFIELILKYLRCLLQKIGLFLLPLKRIRPIIKITWRKLNVFSI